MTFFVFSSLIGLLGYLAHPANSFDYQTQIGIVEFFPDAAPCMTIQNASLKATDSVHIVVLDEPQALEIAKVQKKLPKSCSRDPNADPADAFYLLDSQSKSATARPVSLAIAKFSGQFRVQDGLVRADLAGNSSMNSFHSCTSSEGLHLTVWDGAYGASTRKWHSYYYLGYDVEPTCSEKDYPTSAR